MSTNLTFKIFSDSLVVHWIQYAINSTTAIKLITTIEGTKMIKKLVSMAAITMMIAGTSMADTLDDVIDRGKLRCGVVLDFPPIGFRDSNNQPAGFDVEYCKDMAAALEVELELLELTWADRLPVIVTGRADVVFSSR
jgi:polar amino acid transport system substrate-binding protein